MGERTVQSSVLVGCKLVDHDLGSHRRWGIHDGGSIERRERLRMFNDESAHVMT